MKALTEEIITQIRANYLGSDFVMILNSGEYKTSKLTVGMLTLFNKEDFLLLDSLENITDEDSIEIAKIYGNEQLYTDNIDSLIKHGRHIINCFLNDTARLDGMCYQYLQSNGYALPYIQYSVRDLIELGVYKLKTK